MIIDTHCHLDDSQFDTDLDDVIKRARYSGVGNIIIPGADINDAKKARDIAYAYNDVFFAVGVHPYHAVDYDESRLLEFVDDPKCVAVGECGLDYFRLKDDFRSDEERNAQKEMQKKVFISQIRLAVKLKKPLIVHARDANQDIYDILKEYGKDLVGGVFHCFNASELLLNFEKFYYGIGGVLTFKNAKNLVEILPKIPISKLLVETDAPYLAPTPNRGKRNEPSYTTLVVDKMSEILGFSVSELEDITTKNAKELFKIKE